MQLARHRDEIEAEIQRGTELSLRGARRLIAKPRNGDAGQAAGYECSTGDHNADGGDRNHTLEYFATASGSDIFDRVPEARRAEVLRAFLDRLSVDGLLAAMSSEFGRELRARVPVPKGSRKPSKRR